MTEETKNNDNSESKDNKNNDVVVVPHRDYFYIQTGNIGNLCKELTERALEVISFELMGGLYRVLCQEGDQVGLIQMVQKPTVAMALDEINEFEGQVIKAIPLSGGGVQFIVMYDHETYEAKLKAKEERLAKEKAAEEKALREAEKKALVEKRKAIEKEIKNLS